VVNRRSVLYPPEAETPFTPPRGSHPPDCLLPRWNLTAVTQGLDNPWALPYPSNSKIHSVMPVDPPLCCFDHIIPYTLTRYPTLSPRLERCHRYSVSASSPLPLYIPIDSFLLDAWRTIDSVQHFIFRQIIVLILSDFRGFFS